jgi:hypothetical protein
MEPELLNRCYCGVPANLGNSIPSIAGGEDEDDGWDRAFSLIRLLWPDDKILEDGEEGLQEWDSDKDGTETAEFGPQSEEVEEAVFKHDTSEAHLPPLELSSNLLNELPRIRQWICHCDNASIDHKTGCFSGTQRHLPLLRLIDIERGCIVHAPPARHV